MSIYQRDPAAPGANVGRQRMPRQGRFERAVARFNGSPAAQTVAGLRRTLGPPKGSVGAVAGSPSEVRITMAWDICWYQWGVDLGDELRPVFEIGKGSELDELDRSARQWNAKVSERAGLVLNTSNARRGEARRRS